MKVVVAGGIKVYDVIQHYAVDLLIGPVQAGIPVHIIVAGIDQLAAITGTE